ncbi:hypothetical protein AB1N83_014169 [Pleurotus pulmonarius]
MQDTGLRRVAQLRQPLEGSQRRGLVDTHTRSSEMTATAPSLGGPLSPVPFVPSPLPNAAMPATTPSLGGPLSPVRFASSQRRDARNHPLLGGGPYLPSPSSLRLFPTPPWLQSSPRCRLFLQSSLGLPNAAVLAAIPSPSPVSSSPPFASSQRRDSRNHPLLGGPLSPIHPFASAQRRHSLNHSLAVAHDSSPPSGSSYHHDAHDHPLVVIGNTFAVASASSRPGDIRSSFLDTDGWVVMQWIC